METNFAKGSCHEEVEWEIESYFRKHTFWLKVLESWPLPTIGSLIYLSFVYFGPRYMERRPRFELRKPMLAWSLLLAVFSCLGAMRFNTAILAHLQARGSLGKVVCYSNEAYHYPVIGFWSVLFIYSKFFEYVDTVFIVMRKQKLSFLHWYHHLTVAVYTWYAYKHQLAGSTMFCAMNYPIHALMYLYYSLRAAKVKVPKNAALLITSLQIVQMFCGCVVVGALVIWGNDTSCKTSSLQLVFAITMYGTYLLLFLNFFYQNYLRPHGKYELKGGKSEISKDNSKIE